MPTTISKGAFKFYLAINSIDLGKVAENMTVYLSGLHPASITFTYGSKPISRIRSASSSTTKLTLLKFVIFPLDIASISLMRPGVQTTISVPFFNAGSYPYTLIPP